MCSSAFVTWMCVLTFFQVTAAQKLPDFVSPCKRSDPHFSDCAKRSLESLRPYLKKGIKEFKIPPIDPLHIPQLNVTLSDPRIGTYNAALSNLVYVGAKNYRVIDIDVDLTNLTLRIKLFFPKLNFKTSLAAKGTVLGFEVETANASGGAVFENVTVDVTMNGTLYAKKGKPYVKWEEAARDVAYDQMNIYVNNVFARPELDQAFGSMANNNGDMVYPHIVLLVKSPLGDFLLDVVNRVHKRYSIDVLYPL